MSVEESDWATMATVAAAEGHAATEQEEGAPAATAAPAAGAAEPPQPTQLQPMQQQVVFRGVGIHPWRAHAASPGWLDRLETVLVQHARHRAPGFLVGEIGLDKAARTPETGRCEYAAQKAVFAAQLQLAAKLGRPISVHCVKAAGTMYVRWLHPNHVFMV